MVYERAFKIKIKFFKWMNSCKFWEQGSQSTGVWVSSIWYFLSLAKTYIMSVDLISLSKIIHDFFFWDRKYNLKPHMRFYRRTLFRFKWKPGKTSGSTEQSHPTLCEKINYHSEMYVKVPEISDQVSSCTRLLHK